MKITNTRLAARGSRLEIKFTPAQLDRLKRAAAQIGQGVTVEDLIVSGAMAGLDNSPSAAGDAITAIIDSVDDYARSRVTFASPEHGTADPLQCYVPRSPEQMAS